MSETKFHQLSKSGTQDSSGIELSLHWADYVVLTLFLASNIAIGLYQSLKPAQKRSDTQEYFVGDRRMNYLTMAMSIVMSHVSAILVLGGPAQIYTRGTLYWLFCVGLLLGQLLAAHLCIPVIFPLKLTSVNEVSTQSAEAKGWIYSSYTASKFAPIFQNESKRKTNILRINIADQLALNLS